MTDIERQDVAGEVSVRSLEELENVVERGKMTFLEVGEALAEIRERGLYEERGYGDFASYCKARFGFGEHQGRRTIRVAETFRELEGSLSSDTPAPPTLTHIDILRGIPEPDDRKELWETAHRSLGRTPNTAELRSYVLNWQELRKPIDVTQPDATNENGEESSEPRPSLTAEQKVYHSINTLSVSLVHIDPAAVANCYGNVGELTGKIESIEEIVAFYTAVANELRQLRINPIRAVS